MRWARPVRAWLQRIDRDRLGALGRGLAIVAAVGIAVAAAVAAVLSDGGPATPAQHPAAAGAGPAASAARLPGGSRPGVAPVQVAVGSYAGLPEATTFTTTPAAPLDPAPFSVTSGLVLHPLTPQVLYAGPGKPAVAVLPTAELGAPTWVPVIQTSPGWDQVLIPSRPNHASGWIYTAGADTSELEFRSTPYLIRIELGARKLSIVDHGNLLGTWTVAVGAPATPTPTGRTFVLALLAPPQPTYSPLILPLGFHSDSFETFGGGPGTVGLHGWPDPSVFGHAVSNGCVRVPASALAVLARVPLGSLVLISS